MAKIDFKKRYYHDRLGVLWALLMPICQIIIYYCVFKYVIGVEEEHYGLFLFSGILIWGFFIECVNKGMMVLQSKRYLLENIQFNKLDLFYAQILSVFLGFTFNMSAYFVISMLVGVFPSIYALFLPILLIPVLMISLGMSLLMSILKLHLKDIQHAWDILSLLGLWTGGIFFSAEMITQKLPWFDKLHPFLGIISNIRKSLLYAVPIDAGMFIWNFIYALIIMMVSWMIFNRFKYKLIELF